MARLWESATGRPVRAAARHPQRGVGRLSFSPDGRLLATGSADSTARLWDWTTGEPVSPPLWQADTVYNVTFGPDGRTLLAQIGSQARLWNIAPDERPVAELALICQLGAGVRLDETGARQPLSPDELLAVLRQLKVRYPEEFSFKPRAQRRPEQRSGPD